MKKIEKIWRWVMVWLCALSLLLFLSTKCNAGWRTVEKECVLCAKQITEAVEYSDFYYDNMLSASWPMGYPAGVSATTIEYSNELVVCRECQERYRDKFDIKMNMAWSEIVRSVKTGNAELISQNRKINHEAEQAKIKQQIKELETQLKEQEQ